MKMKRSQISGYTQLAGWNTERALFVVAHARYQRSRGKNPSEPYKGERNPFKALRLAHDDLRIYEPMCGSWIPASIATMSAIAKLSNQEVTGKFNDVSVTADPTTPASVLVARWETETNRQREEYRKSPKYQRQARLQEIEVAALQMKMNEMMARLETLNFDDLAAVINWFDQIRDASDHVGVSVPSGEIVQKFEEHGYIVNANTEDAYNPEDKENSAHYLIGQALSCLKEVGAIHQVYRDFAKEWREKFLGSDDFTAGLVPQPVN